jgi:hypothetical protein
VTHAGNLSSEEKGLMTLTQQTECAPSACLPSRGSGEVLLYDMTEVWGKWSRKMRLQHAAL